MVFQDTIKLAPQEKGATEITTLISSIIKDSKIKLGTCQGIYLWEKTSRPDERKLTITITGE